MGYFSNGTSGEIYVDTYCSKCSHFDKPCPIWGAHLAFNYDECNNDQSILDILIPRCKDTLENKKCVFFDRKQDDLFEGDES